MHWDIAWRATVLIWRSLYERPEDCLARAAGSGARGPPAYFSAGYDAIRQLKRKPAVIGHSFGGMLDVGFLSRYNSGTGIPSALFEAIPSLRLILMQDHPSTSVSSRSMGVVSFLVVFSQRFLWRCVLPAKQ